jgi:hypothetical protein
MKQQNSYCKGNVQQQTEQGLAWRPLRLLLFLTTESQGDSAKVAKLFMRMI